MKRTLRSALPKLGDEFESDGFKHLNKNEVDESDDQSDDGSGKSNEDVLSESQSEGGNSDDDAPDDVTFDASKRAALANMQEAVAIARANRTEKKEKRRKLDARLKEQKKNKLARLEEARLPESMLEQLGAKAPPSQQRLDDGEDEGGDGGDERKERKSRKGDAGDVEDDCESDGDSELDGSGEDFISLGKAGPAQRGNVLALTLKDSGQLANSKEKALAFQQQRLYGSGVARESSKSMLSRRSKCQYVNSR